MKKYLICGAAALITGMFITSCTHDDIEYKSIVEEKNQAFEELFTELYGERDINHDWGFTPLPNIQEIIGNANALSRATTRSVDKRSNMWASEGWVIPTPLTTAQKNLVRNYFQQNKNPKGISVDYKNFFVQQVYKGHTNLKEANADCLEEYKNKDNQDVIGSEHMDHLTAGFPPDHINDFNNSDRGEIDVLNNGGSGTHKDAITLMVNSNTSCFGYQGSEDSQIHYDEHSYVIISGETIMNWAKTEGANLSEVSVGADVTGMVFVGFDYFATGSNPNQQSDADGYFSDWIVKITEGVKSDSHSGDPNDPHSNVTTGKKVRVLRHTVLDKGRVFCEDLYNASKEDLDFNDVVFDAILWLDQECILDKDGNLLERFPDTNRYYAEIVLIATGATLPLQVAEKEIHNVFNTERNLGISTGEDKVMVNTVIGSTFNGAFRNSINPVKLTWGEGVNRFEVTDLINDTEDYTLNIIPVVVQYQREKQTTATALKKGDVVGNKMTAPHKICVPIDTPWPGERRNIASAYTEFKKWVNDEEGNSNFTAENYRVQDNLYNENWTNQLTNIDEGNYYDEQLEVINEVEGNLVWPTANTIPNIAQDLGVWSNMNQVYIKPYDLFINANITENQKIRIYGEAKDNSWCVQLYGAKWGNNGAFPNDGKLAEHDNSTDPDFANLGYFDIPINTYIKNMLRDHYNDDTACIIQGNNFIIEYITIVP